MLKPAIRIDRETPEVICAQPELVQGVASGVMEVGAAAAGAISCAWVVQ
jgi:hypothetical protein